MCPSPEHKHHAGEVMALSPYTESPGWHWAWQCHCSCLSPQSVFALLYLNLSPRSVGGCCPDRPDSIALWLLVGFGQGRGTSRSGSWRREKEGVFPLPFPPCRFVVWPHLSRTTVHARQLIPVSIVPQKQDLCYIFSTDVIQTPKTMPSS